MIENPVNLVNGQRAIGTTYYNNTGLPMLVIVSVFSDTANVVYTAAADSSANPSTVVYKTVGDNNSSYNDVSLTFFVMPGQFYSVTASAGSTTIEGWREFICQRGAMTDSGDIHTTPGRALATVYQNTSGKTMFVVAQVASVNAASAVLGLSDSSPAPTNVVDSFMQNSSGANTVTVIMIVPNGHYYEVTAASGSLALWHEYSWAISCQKSTDLILTSGSGQLRTGAGSAAQVNTGSSTSTFGSQQYWQNNTQAVRWVQVITTSGAADSFCQIAAGDGIPPYQILSVCRRHTAASSRHTYGPVLPGKTYAFLDTTNSTLTQSHWWEYQLG